jgi:hypothetical protein
VQDNDVVASRAGACPVSILERPVVFGKCVAGCQQPRRGGRRGGRPLYRSDLMVCRFVCELRLRSPRVGTPRPPHRDWQTAAGGCSLGRAAGRRSSGCWGFERKAVDSCGRSERHRRDLELAGGSLSSRWSWCWKVSCRLSRKSVAVGGRSRSASRGRPHASRRPPHRARRAARVSACRSGSALRRPEVLAEVLARGFERKGVAPEL